MLREETNNLVANSMLRRAFGWMMVALAITGGIAWYMVQRPDLLMHFLKSPSYLFGTLIVQLGVALLLITLLPRLSYGIALLLFFAYSALTGLTVSTIFYNYDIHSIARAFLITSGMFGAMAVYGYVTKADLSSMRSFLFMGLMGVIVAGVVNIFVYSSMMSFIISCVSVVVFCGFTAYDVHRLKQYALLAYDAGEENFAKIGLYGAFMLYLDFINLFFAILNITGKRKE